MKTVIESYGTAILASIAVASLIILLMIIPDGKGNVGIFEIIGANSNIDNSLYENMNDTKEVLKIYNRTDAPVIAFNNIHFTAKQQYLLGDGFTVKPTSDSRAYKLSDCIKNNSSAFTYDVVSLTTERGIDYLGIYNDRTGTIQFPAAGNYIITIRCYNKANGKTAINTFTIPVDNKPIG